MQKLKLEGKRFGRLLVIGESHKNDYGKYVWDCQCECGNVLKVVGSDLKNGHTKSCGCLHDYACKERATIHGYTKKNGIHSMYGTWTNIKTDVIIQMTNTINATAVAV